MSDETLSLIMRARDEMSGAVNRAAGNLDKLGKSGATANSILSGIGSGLGIAGVLGVANAVGTATRFLEDSVRAAMEDERSVARLNVSLRDNVMAWSGNTTAIEKAIATRTRLGFADDVLRQSLGTLVTRTHDVNGALGLVDQAMDLARYRGIDLAAATDLIGKAYDGNISALRRAGIAVDEHATKQQALEAVLRSTGGQARAYADTDLGALEQASIDAGEASEALGRKLSPYVAEAAKGAATGIDLLDWVLTNLGKTYDEGTNPAMRFFNATKGGGDAAKLAHDALGQYTGQVDISAAHMAGAASAAQQLAWSINLVRLNADPTTAAIKTNAAGSWTAASALQAVAAGLGQSSVGATKARTEISGFTDAVTGGVSRSTAALDRMIERLRALDAAQQTVFDRMIRNLTRVIDTQLAALDAAAAQRDADRQAIADKRDLADALRALGEAQAAAAANPEDAGAQQALLAAQRRVQDVRDRMAETALRSQEAKLRASLEATKTYIEAVAELERNATNRKALANTLAAREKSLLESRAKAEAAGDTQGVAEIDMKLAAIRAAMVRNEEAMKIAKATTAIQVYTTVHTKISVDGKTLAEIVDKYLGSKPT